MSLVACNGISAKDGTIVSFTNHDGESIDLLTDAVYSKYEEGTEGVSKFYDAILEALIRYEYADNNSAVRKAMSVRSEADIKSEAENNVENDKSNAKVNASTNDTSYEKEWDKILESHNCEDEDELLEYYIYQLEKEDITEKFFLKQKDSTLVQEWLGVTDQGASSKKKVNGVFPYHIRHVLTSISGGANDYYSGTITEAEAKNLKNTMEALLTYDTFARVALEKSNDDSSKVKGGDVGVMTTTTSFVNEFKLGIYAYDAIYTHKNDAANNTIKPGLGITDEYKLHDLFVKDGEQGIEQAWKWEGSDKVVGINGGKIQTVPYGAFLTIGDLADVTTDENNKQVNNGKEQYFPRNILYNYYLNFHNPFVITQEVLDTDMESDYLNRATFGFPIDDDQYDDRFVEVTFADDTTLKVLCDENKNPIIGVRSEHGIHFMIMEKSIYDYRIAGEGVDEASLEEYYTTLTTTDSNYPKTPEGKNKDTYVNYQSGSSNENTRANEVKTAIQSFDQTYDYRVYEYILGIENGRVTINNASLKEKIQEYIDVTRATNNENAEKTLHEAWRTYTELVANQYMNRTVWEENKLSETWSADAPFRSVNPRCAIGFKSRANKTSSNEWNKDKGGYCYYED